MLVIGELPAAQPTLYDYYWDPAQTKWVPWVQIVPKYVHDPSRKFHEILVPTMDTVRATWLLKLQVRIKRPVLFVGETGTSKTATISNFLRELNPDAYVSILPCLNLLLNYFWIFVNCNELCTSYLPNISISF